MDNYWGQFFVRKPWRRRLVDPYDKYTGNGWEKGKLHLLSRWIDWRTPDMKVPVTVLRRKLWKRIPHEFTVIFYDQSEKKISKRIPRP
jgi:hypothetical protein